MPRNKLSDLNDHLFQQIERLNDDELKGEALMTEVQRAKAIADLASNIVGAAKVTVDAAKLLDKNDGLKSHLPLLFDKNTPS